MGIRLLKRHEIIDYKWNQCVSESLFNCATLYAWYLDIVCDAWDALIIGDYEAVMPIPYKRKMGIKVATHPNWVQQLGVLSNKIFETDHLNQIYKRFPFLVRHIQVNSNSFRSGRLKILKELCNYELSLLPNFEQLYANFSTNIKRNIKKGEFCQLKTKSSSDVEQFIHFFIQNARFSTSSQEQSRLKELIKASILNKKGWLEFVYGADNQLVCAVFWLKTTSRLLYHTAVTSSEGFKIGANAWLISQTIEHNCSSPLLLDFGGSQQLGIARFFAGFGAVNNPFYLVSPNKIIYSIEKVCRSVFSKCLQVKALG